MQGTLAGHRVVKVGAAVALLSLVIACQRDPGRDVVPVSGPRSSAAASPSTGIIPIDQVSKSQAGVVTQRIADTEITVTYSRPVARGRAIFGALVPYGEIWNPGADRATAIALTRDITVNGQRLAAGKYSVWATPGADRWTVILSRAADVYHTPYPGPAEDELRLDVRPEPAPHAEVLTFEFPMVEGKDAKLQLRWGTVAIALSITVP